MSIVSNISRCPHCEASGEVQANANMITMQALFDDILIITMKCECGTVWKNYIEVSKVAKEMVSSEPGLDTPIEMI